MTGCYPGMRKVTGRQGRIDLLLCETISRFWRNSVDVLCAIRETFTGADEFIDLERVEAIAASMNRRIQTLGDFLLIQQPQADSTENDVERNVAAEYGMGQRL